MKIMNKTMKMKLKNLCQKMISIIQIICNKNFKKISILKLFKIVKKNSNKILKIKTIFQELRKNF